MFAKIFDVEDLTRRDSAFDAVAKFEDERVGIGLKTWIHTRDLTYQKVAEFNKVAPIEFSPLIEEKEYDELIYKISELRNERIKLDKRQYNTNHEIYHNITRDNNQMNVVETNYDLIQLDSLKLLSQTSKTYVFSDGLNTYKYYASKSVLLKEFEASPDKVLEKIPIIQFDDPFELLKMIELPVQAQEEVQDTIYLPLYSDVQMKVEEKSGFNAWNAAPKNKGSNILRPEYEAYIPIPKWIHHTFPKFFGFDALDRRERNIASSFTLHLPDDRKFKAIVTQDSGKSLQTNPQKILGKWILHDVLGLQPRELLTMEHLMKLGVDSLKLTKLDNTNFKIELADTYAFENWKIEIEDKIRESGSRMPTLRPHLLEEE
ncbi:restriction endonuclease PLD domain-containing protein [Lacicoccus alkaliphilus]|uniref:NgoFVII restriction endonuclease n=1 Tax=Lacicoccus alkaliphilus DSM 16010 TaxID=1123231 RepID=A0A1M7KJK0_9BACL|nr:restriction endonuclease PLD domain-containing protein [Salinicoccus alkaliphilus]SHM65562.1 NgoFVII restriction endonuclease [Salinicoccus alkaliphilus DSM 16010]